MGYKVLCYSMSMEQESQIAETRAVEIQERITRLLEGMTPEQLHQIEGVVAATAEVYAQEEELHSAFSLQRDEEQLIAVLTERLPDSLYCASVGRILSKEEIVAAVRAKDISTIPAEFGLRETVTTLTTEAAAYEDFIPTADAWISENLQVQTVDEMKQRLDSMIAFLEQADGDHELTIRRVRSWQDEVVHIEKIIKAGGTLVPTGHPAYQVYTQIGLPQAAE